MPVVYVINVRHDENNVFSILKPSTVVRPLTAPRSCIFQHPNSNFWSNIRAGFLQETWRKTRSTARPANKVPPKPSRMPYRSGRATSRGPFWYWGTGARSTIRSRSRQDKSLANTHTHTGQTGQTHLPSQRTAGALLSSFNLNETPRRIKRKKKENGQVIITFLNFEASWEILLMQWECWCWGVMSWKHAHGHQI